MSFQEFAGCILRGSEAAKPAHATFFTDFKYEALDTGNVYYDNGTAWVLLSGPEKAETLKNKIVNFDDNTVSGVLRDPFSTNKRIGYLIPSLSASASLQLALRGMPSVGTYSLEYDATEGYFSRLNTTLAERFGWFNTTTPIVTRREHSPRLKIRSKLNVNSNISFWMGFSNTLPQLSSVPFPNGAQFVVVGMSASYTTNFHIITNDGTNDGGLATPATFLKGAATSWNTYEIIMTDTNITVKLGPSLSYTVNTRLPALSENLYLMMFCYNVEAVTKNLDIVKTYFESDIS